MEFLYETHCHTAESSRCASVSAAEQVRIYKNGGYTGIIVTDHFIHGNTIISNKLLWKSWEKKIHWFVKGYETAKTEGDKIEPDVFFGWEYSHFGTHILTYGLGIDFLLANPNMCRLNVKKYCVLIRENGGYVAQAHPFRTWMNLRKSPINPALIDGIEVYNSKRSDKANTKAFKYASLHNLPVQSGTDSHKSNLAFYSGITLDKKTDSIFDIIEAIKSKNVGLILPDNIKEMKFEAMKLPNISKTKPCPKCPYKLGKVQFMTNPCPSCKTNNYSMYEILANGKYKPGEIIVNDICQQK